MFDDPKEELRRLERRLLEEEDREEDSGEDWPEDEWTDDCLFSDEDSREDDWEDEDHRRWAGRARNTDPVDVDMEEYSRRVYHAPRKKGTGCLVLLACLELLGIGALVAYWLLVLL